MTSVVDAMRHWAVCRVLITASGLTKRYASVLALDQLDLDLEPGIIGLVGSNGAGKSTLIRILLGLVEPTSGSARMFDLDVVSEGLEVRRLVGYMPEHDCLPLDINATEFVAHMARVNGLPREPRERTAEILRLVGLFEERYREMRGYSTGMRQRVKLAQALVHDPKLVLLDEPHERPRPGRPRPDARPRCAHREEFGISIMMSSHLLAEIERVCDHLVLIEGRLVQSGSISAFTGRIELLTVEVGSATALAATSRRRGYSYREVSTYSKSTSRTTARTT